MAYQPFQPLLLWIGLGADWLNPQIRVFEILVGFSNGRTLFQLLVVWHGGCVCLLLSALKKMDGMLPSNAELIILKRLSLAWLPMTRFWIPFHETAFIWTGKISNQATGFCCCLFQCLGKEEGTYPAISPLAGLCTSCSVSSPPPDIIYLAPPRIISQQKAVVSKWAMTGERFSTPDINSVQIRGGPDSFTSYSWSAAWSTDDICSSHIHFHSVPLYLHLFPFALDWHLLSILIFKSEEHHAISQS